MDTLLRYSYPAGAEHSSGGFIDLTAWERRFRTHMALCMPEIRLPSTDSEYAMLVQAYEAWIGPEEAARRWGMFMMGYGGKQ